MPRTTRNATRSLYLAAAAVCATASLSTLLPADDAAFKNQVTKIDLGVKPLITSPGVVIVTRASSTYVTFHATQYGEEGASEGIAVIRLAGCSDWNLRSPGDEALALHTVDIEALDCCETYEVFNSEWAAYDPSSRHLIITFLGFSPGVSEGAVNFECLAQDATVHFMPSSPFNEILDNIDFLEATRPIDVSNPALPVEEQKTSEEDEMTFDAYWDADGEYYTDEDYLEFE